MKRKRVIMSYPGNVSNVASVSTGKFIGRRVAPGWWYPGNGSSGYRYECPVSGRIDTRQTATLEPDHLHASDRSGVRGCVLVCVCMQRMNICERLEQERSHAASAIRSVRSCNHSLGTVFV